MMRASGRGLLLAVRMVLATAAVLVAGTAVRAADFPTKPITVVVPFPPGGSTDLLARQIAEKIAGPLGQPVVVENRAGAGGTVGASYVARAKPDGHTLLMGVTGSNAISPVLREDVPYDPVTGFSPVSVVVSSPLVLVVKADSPLKDAQAFSAAAKAKPGALSHGTPGVGTAMHLTGELYGLESKTKLLHIPYKGSAAALQDLLGGRLDTMFADILVTAEFIKSGQLRALAVTSMERHFMLPDVPTLAEVGLPGFQALSWQGVFAPAGTPEPILAKLHSEIAKALKNEDLRKSFADGGFIVEGRSPGESKAFVEAEVKRWRRVVDEAGLKIK